ncbi:unnamed protein product (macronuclear) [Paramecium tetraurelia]|uniref:Cyclic nucleotide-binding domain-containing protein n=1 Tax=Paramecium tetraurelia TaxID=5888 RepID=A0CP78_PARTE|nr:uncharacterized protein GSPATT00008986001 [Paramecium tetraurelia]CAK72595.1 unnamed protein product [Paramecium tetraurelia]|eukprot:XP_001439992.1 hypothetical protein (macronuclear) [Paramecium tetraurelia strain d4-2]
MSTVIGKGQQAYNETTTQRRKNEANLRVTLQYYSKYGKLTDDHSLEQVAPGLASLEFMKRNCPERTKLEEFCIQSGQYFEFEQYKQGDIIFHYGDIGDKVYIILKGDVAVLVPRAESEIVAEREEISQAKLPFEFEMFQRNKKPSKSIQIEVQLAQQNSNFYFKDNVCLFKKVFQFYSGQSFGDVALISDKPRTASILVTSDQIYLISMCKKDFKISCEKSVLEMNQTLDYFVTVLPYIGKMQISKFIQFFHKTDFSPQQWLWKEGEQVKFFILILKGRVEIKQQQMPLYQVSDNSFIGHEEILEGLTLRQYGCKTLDNTIAYLMDYEDFNVARKNAPDIVKVLIEKAKLMTSYLERRKEEVKKGQTNVQPLYYPVERRLIQDMFVIKSPRNNEVRSNQPKFLSYFDITKFNKKKAKPNPINQQQSISEDLYFSKEKNLKTTRSPSNYTQRVSPMTKQMKEILLKKFKLNFRFNAVGSLKISSCKSANDLRNKSRFKTDASIDN